MIPRQHPTYSFRDLWQAWRLARSGEDVEARLGETLCEMYGVKHAIFFNRGRSALYTLFVSMPPGKVLMPGYTCIVVPEAADIAGRGMVFADIDLTTLNMELSHLQAAMQPAVSTVVVTHQFGIPAAATAEMVAYAHEHGATVIEDAAPALGARLNSRLVGTYGDAAVISFENTKVISAGGGAVCLTDRDDLAERLRNRVEPLPTEPSAVVWRRCVLQKLATFSRWYRLVLTFWEHGRERGTGDQGQPLRQMPSGYVSRISPFSAALTLVQLPHLSANLRHRQSLAEAYTQVLGSLPQISGSTTPLQSKPSWTRYAVRVGNKVAFYRHMKQHSVDLAWSFDYTCSAAYGVSDPSNCHAAAMQVIDLPLHAAVREGDVGRVAHALHAWDWPGSKMAK